MAATKKAKIDTQTSKKVQPPQFEEDKAVPGCNGDTPNNWLRGYGQNPNFDRHKVKR